MGAIFKRELKSYFDSMIGYIFIAFLMFFIGLYFFLVNVLNGYPYVSIILLNVIFIFMFAFPILTMRSMAEERKTKTDQLLLTSPVSVTGMVMGKFFAMAGVYGTACLLSCLCPLIMLMRDSHYPITDFCSIFAFFLLGCVYIAIGMYISSLTESQIIAAVLSIGVFVLLYLMPTLVSFVPTGPVASLVGFLLILLVVCIIYFVQSRNLYVSAMLGMIGAIAISVVYAVKPELYENALPAILNELSLTTPFEMFAYYSVFDLTGVVYYVSIIALFCYMTVLSVQKRRWS